METMKKILVACVIACSMLFIGCDSCEYSKKGILEYCEYLKEMVKEDFGTESMRCDDYLGIIYHIEGYFVDNNDTEVYSSGYEDRIDSIINNYKNVEVDTNYHYSTE